MTDRSDVAAPRSLPSLTSLRWYAALLVFVFHVAVLTAWRAVHPFAMGYTGVTFFFVLSGFVLTWSAQPQRGLLSFYRARAARVYPAHLAVLLLMALALVVTAGPHPQQDLGPGLAVALLVQSWWPTADVAWQWNPVSWSLSAEVFFYAVFPFALAWTVRRGVLAQRVATATTLVAAVAAVLVLRQHGAEGVFAAGINPAVRLPQFLLGILLALEVRRWGPRRVPPVWAGVALFAFLSIVSWRVIDRVPSQLLDYIMLPGFVLLIVACALRDCDHAARSRVLHHRVSTYLGELSFCFYLVHFLVITGLLHAAGWYERTTWSVSDGALTLLFSLVVSACAAAALHHGVEKPVRRLLVGRPGAPRHQQPAVVESQV